MTVRAKTDSTVEALKKSFKGLGNAKDLVRAALATVRGTDVDNLTRNEMPNEEEVILVKKLVLSVIDDLLPSK